MNVELLAQIPIVESICESGDAGAPIAMNKNSIVGNAFVQLADKVIKKLNTKN